MSSSAPDPDRHGAAAAQDGSEQREWRYPEPPEWRTWTLRDVAKAAVPLVAGALLVWVPYVALVLWATNAIVERVDLFPPVVALALVVFLTLTTFSSFLLSAVTLVERLLPWESPLTA